MFSQRLALELHVREGVNVDGVVVRAEGQNGSVRRELDVGNPLFGNFLGSFLIEVFIEDLGLNNLNLLSEFHLCSQRPLRTRPGTLQRSFL